MSPVSALVNLMVLFAGILFFVMPEMSRPGILFGVSVKDDFRHTDEGRELLRSYRRMIAVLTLAAVALGSLVLSSELWIPLRVGLEGLGSIACWIWISRKTRPFAEHVSPIRIASLTSKRQLVPGGWLFVIGPYLILALAAWFLYANWNSIPELFPTHWGRNGFPDRWATRTTTGVFGLLLVALAANTLTILIALAIYFGARTARSASGGNAADVAFKRATFFLILFIDYFISTVFAVMAARPIWSDDPGSSPSRFVPLIFLCPRSCCRLCSLSAARHAIPNGVRRRHAGRMLEVGHVLLQPQRCGALR